MTRRLLTVSKDLDVGTDAMKSFVEEPCEDWLSHEKSEWLDWLSLTSSFIVISSSSCQFWIQTLRIVYVIVYWVIA